MRLTRYPLLRWIHILAKPNQRPVLPNKHLNRGLFSDYYLDEIVPTSSEFQSNTLFASVKTIRDALLERLDNLTPEELDEAQLEDRWIKPVLEALGHHWSVQVKIRYRDKGLSKRSTSLTRYDFSGARSSSRCRVTCHVSKQISGSRKVSHRRSRDPKSRSMAAIRQSH